MKKQHAKMAVTHAHDGDGHHAVALTSLRVMLLPDSSGWFAQGLEIDYAACGETIDEAKKNFEAGFCATIHEHLRMHGSIKHFLKVADTSAWDEFYTAPKDSIKQSFSCVQIHDLNDASCDVSLPFDSIAFISRESTANAKPVHELQPA